MSFYASAVSGLDNRLVRSTSTEREPVLKFTTVEQTRAAQRPASHGAAAAREGDLLSANHVFQPLGGGK
jgi:hypothetical protein